MNNSEIVVYLSIAGVVLYLVCEYLYGRYEKKEKGAFKSNVYRVALIIAGLCFASLIYYAEVAPYLKKQQRVKEDPCRYAEEEELAEKYPKLKALKAKQLDQYISFSNSRSLLNVSDEVAMRRVEEMDKFSGHQRLVFQEECREIIKRDSRY